MPKLFPCLLPLALLFLAAWPAPGGAATLAPLEVQDAVLLPEHAAELRLGGGYAADRYNLFQEEDRDRRVALLPRLTLNLGLGKRVEGQLDYALLHLDQDGQSASWGSGDLTVAFKVRLLPETLSLPALALRVATKLPNADDGKDFGTDETDFFASLLASRNFPGFSVHANLGLAILGDPRPGHSGQDDLLLYRLGLVVPLGWAEARALVGVEGQDLGGDLTRRGVLSGGFQVPLGPLLWDLGAGVGYVKRSEDWSVRTGFTGRFSLPSAW